MRKKRIIIPLAIIAVVLVAMVMLEPVLLKKINEEGAKVSKVFHFEAEDLDIALLRAGVALQEIKVKTKENQQEFLSVKNVNVSVSWKEVFSGRLLTRVSIDGIGLRYSKGLLPKIKVFQQEIKDLKEKLSKDMKEDEEGMFRVARLDVANSSITMTDYPSLKPGQAPHISEIKAHITNLTPSSKRPISNFDFKAVILEAGGVESQGQVNLMASPIEWSVDGEVQKLDMTSTNDFLKKRVPLTFTKGMLDMYAEAKSEDGKIQGYLKPFLKDVDVIENKEDFKSTKHWFIEVLSALGNLILRAPDKASVATRVPFKYDGKKVDIEAQEAVGEAIQHGFGEKLERGIENKFKLE